MNNKKLNEKEARLIREAWKDAEAKGSAGAFGGDPDSIVAVVKLLTITFSVIKIFYPIIKDWLKARKDSDNEDKVNNKRDKCLKEEKVEEYDERMIVNIDHMTVYLIKNNADLGDKIANGEVSEEALSEVLKEVSKEDGDDNK